MNSAVISLESLGHSKCRKSQKPLSISNILPHVAPNPGPRPVSRNPSHDSTQTQEIMQSKKILNKRDSIIEEDLSGIKQVTREPGRLNERCNE